MVVEKDKIYEVTDEDRTFFDDLVNRQADQTPERTIINDDGEEINITRKDETPDEKDPKLPDWYQPHMKNRVGWLNGVPQKPLTKEDRKREYGRGRWVDAAHYE